MTCLRKIFSQRLSYRSDITAGRQQIQSFNTSSEGYFQSNSLATTVRGKSLRDLFRNGEVTQALRLYDQRWKIAACKLRTTDPPTPNAVGTWVKVTQTYLMRLCDYQVSQQLSENREPCIGICRRTFHLDLFVNFWLDSIDVYRQQICICVDEPCTSYNDTDCFTCNLVHSYLFGVSESFSS